MRHAAAGRRSRPAPAAPPHLPRPAGVLPLHGRPGRRGPGARPQRRGLPRARLLGRALCLSLPELPASRRHPRAADVPLPASRPGPGRRARCRLPRRDVPVAERQRRQGGDTGRPPQPAVGPLGAGPQSQPAACQRRDLLQHLELLRGHRGPRLPARVRRRDDARDRALLGLDRHLQPRPRPLRDPRRDGPGRVPREVSGRGRGRAAQQRLHERDGRVDRRDRPEGARPAARESPRGAVRPPRAHRRRSPAGTR